MDTKNEMNSLIFNGILLNEEKDEIEKATSLEEKKRLEKKYKCLKLAYALSQNKNVVIKGSFLFSILCNDYNRETADLDFILNVEAPDDVKINQVNEIISNIDSNIIMRKKTSFLRYGYYSYLSDIDDQIENIRIECLIKAPIEKQVEEITYEGYKINAIKYTKQFVDKLFSMCYFHSPFFRGDNSRRIAAIYDVDKMLTDENIKLISRVEIADFVTDKISQDKPIHINLYGQELDLKFMRNALFEFDDDCLNEAEEYIVKKYNKDFSIAAFISKFENIRLEILKIMGKKYDGIECNKREFILSNKNYGLVKALLYDAVDKGIDFKLHSQFRNKREMDFEPSNIPIAGMDMNSLIKEVQTNILPYCSNFSSEGFLGFPDAGNSIAGMYGSILADLINQNIINSSFCSYIGTKIDIEVISWFRRLIGYSHNEIKDIHSVGGIVTNGGTISNSIAMLLARENNKCATMNEGLYGTNRMFVVIPKGIDHYSIRCSLQWLGMGYSVLEVETVNYKYNLEKLQEVVEKYKESIFCVVAYAGDSRTMSIDNFSEIYNIVKRISDKIWLHADACHGFSLAFSEQLRCGLNGIELFDSITLDPHKVMMIPYTVSLLLIKNPEKFKLISTSSDLITKEEFSFGQITPFIGSKSFLSLKLWMVLKHIGVKNMGEIIEKRHNMAVIFKQKLEDTHRFLVLNDVEINSVMFIYSGVKKADDFDYLNIINKKIYKRICEEGVYYIHQFPIIDDKEKTGGKNMLFPLRFMCGNPILKESILDDFIKYILRIAEEIENEKK